MRSVTGDLKKLREVAFSSGILKPYCLIKEEGMVMLKP